MKLGFTFSTSDIFNVRHVKIIDETNRHCEYLNFGLELDPSFRSAEKNSPTQFILERYIKLKVFKHLWLIPKTCFDKINYRFIRVDGCLLFILYLSTYFVG